jgi:hypothetical protein
MCFQIFTELDQENLTPTTAAGICGEETAKLK